jgi:hypothetical protein
VSAGAVAGCGNKSIIAIKKAYRSIRRAHSLNKALWFPADISERCQMQGIDISARLIFLEALTVPLDCDGIQHAPAPIR